MLVREIGPFLSCLIDWLVGFDMRACCYYKKKYPARTVAGSPFCLALPYIICHLNLRSLGCCTAPLGRRCDYIHMWIV